MKSYCFSICYSLFNVHVYSSLWNCFAFPEYGIALRMSRRSRWGGSSAPWQEGRRDTEEYIQSFTTWLGHWQYASWCRHGHATKQKVVRIVISVKSFFYKPCALMLRRICNISNNGGQGTSWQLIWLFMSGKNCWNFCWFTAVSCKKLHSVAWHFLSDMLKVVHTSMYAHDVSSFLFSRCFTVSFLSRLLN